MQSLYIGSLRKEFTAVTQTRRDRLLELAAQCCVRNTFTFHASLPGCSGRGRHLYRATSCHRGGEFCTSETWLNAHFTPRDVLGSQCQRLELGAPCLLPAEGMLILFAGVSSHHFLPASPSPPFFLFHSALSMSISLCFSLNVSLWSASSLQILKRCLIWCAAHSLMSYLCHPLPFYASWFSTSLLRVVY